MIRPHKSWELEGVAKDFFRTLWTDPPPVNVELILEKRLGVELIPHPHLRHRNVEAFPVRNALSGHWTIYFDEALVDNEARYRFTLAEELAHFLLHKDLISNFKSEEEYFEQYDDIPPTLYGIFDRNAKYLAAKILVPAEHYRDAVMEVVNRKLREMPPDYERILSASMHELAGLYAVSWDVLKNRLREGDVQMDSWIREQVAKAKTSSR